MKNCLIIPEKRRDNRGKWEISLKHFPASFQCSRRITGILLRLRLAMVQTFACWVYVDNSF